MSLARLVVAAVRFEGRSKAEVAREYRVSRPWVHELIKRFDAEGEAGLEPRSRRPHRSPAQTPVGLEEEIVELRTNLADRGLDAGAPHHRVPSSRASRRRSFCGHHLEDPVPPGVRHPPAPEAAAGLLR